MALEIERRFLIKNDNWKKFITKKIFIEQGYLSKSLDDWIIRIRFTGKNYKIASLEQFKKNKNPSILLGSLYLIGEYKKRNI